MSGNELQDRSAVSGRFTLNPSIRSCLSACPIGYDSLENEVNMNTFVGFTLSYQCSLLSTSNMSLEIQQKVSCYLPAFNPLFSLAAPAFSITLYYKYSLLALKFKKCFGSQNILAIKKGISSTLSRSQSKSIPSN